MQYHICETCGTQTGPHATAPAICPICADDRQFVAWSGQSWISKAELAAAHSVRTGYDHGLPALAIEPAFAIGQRALLLQTGAGSILWECLSLVTPEAVAFLKSHGGVDMIAISHPHYYSSMRDWSQAFGSIPILLHEADRAWIQTPDINVRFWSGDIERLSEDVTLIRCGGHFPGSTALHWSKGDGALFPGDAPQVAMNRRGVSFMYSYPNFMPMRRSDVEAMRHCLASFAFDCVFGYSWGRVIDTGARALVAQSFQRFFAALQS